MQNYNAIEWPQSLHAFMHVSFHIQVQLCQLFTSSLIDTSFKPALYHTWYLYLPSMQYTLLQAIFTAFCHDK